MTAANEPVAAPGRGPGGRGWLIPAILASAILVLLCGVGGIFRYTDLFRPAGITPLAVGPSASTTPSASAPPTSPATVPPTTTPPASPTSKATGPGNTAPSGPRVDTLRVSQQPSCRTEPGGTFGGQIELQWTVAGGATGSQLFLDGGLFDTYGTNERIAIAFACDGNPGDTVTHTYTVTTIGGGPQASRTVSASATIPH